MLAHVAYTGPPLTREEPKTVINSRFNSKQQMFLGFALLHYASIGVDLNAFIFRLTESCNKDKSDAVTLRRRRPSPVLNAITPVQVEDLISLLERNGGEEGKGC